MGLVSDARAARRLVRRVLRRRRLRAAFREVQASRPELPVDTFEAVIYFSDRKVNLYQIRQWYEPMRRLAQKHPVVVIARSMATASILMEECPLPIFYGPTIGDIESFVETQPLKVAFYVNQNMRNFQMMRFPGMFHVFISHGESDKIYMASNQAKAYDYSFVAGDAAVQRISSRLLSFDAGQRLLRIGRPQVDVIEPGPELPQDGRTVVLYAPTWEGDRPSMRYGSIASHGLGLLEQLLATGRHRVIYRPHPRTGVSDQEYRAAARQATAMIERANAADPTAGHLVDTESPFGWHLRSADVCVCDISAVAFDWLATGKPLLLTRPSAEEAEVDHDGIAGKLPLLLAGATDTVERIDAALGTDLARYRALTEHYFGDTTPGASMQRFLDACDQVIARRDQAVAEGARLVTRSGSRTVPSSEPPAEHLDLVADSEREDITSLDA